MSDKDELSGFFADLENERNLIGYVDDDTRQLLEHWREIALPTIASFDAAMRGMHELNRKIIEANAVDKLPLYTPDSRPDLLENMRGRALVQELVDRIDGLLGDDPASRGSDRPKPA